MRLPVPWVCIGYPNTLTSIVPHIYHIFQLFFTVETLFYGEDNMDKLHYSNIKDVKIGDKNIFKIELLRDENVRIIAWKTKIWIDSNIK